MCILVTVAAGEVSEHKLHRGRIEFFRITGVASAAGNCRMLAEQRKLGPRVIKRDLPPALDIVTALAGGGSGQLPLAALVRVAVAYLAGG